jgi:hypothetical protein
MYHGVNGVRQTEIHTSEPLVPELSASDIELAIEKLKSHKSPGIDQIPAELIKAVGKTIRCEIHKLIISIWNKEELPEERRSRSFYLSVRRSIKQIVLIIKAYQFCQLRTKLYPTSCCQYAEAIIGDHQCGFRRHISTTDHIFCILHILKKQWE